MGEIIVCREAYQRLVARRRAGEVVTWEEVDLAGRLATMEDDTEGLRSGRKIRCPGCGAIVGRAMLMSASLGTACPDCYDRLSDAESGWR